MEQLSSLSDREIVEYAIDQMTEGKVFEVDIEMVNNNLFTCIVICEDCSHYGSDSTVAGAIRSAFTVLEDDHANK